MSSSSEFQNNKIPNYSATRETLIFGLSPLHSLLNVAKYMIYYIGAAGCIDINDETVKKIHSEIIKEFNLSLGEIRHGNESQINGNIVRRFFQKENFYKFCNCILESETDVIWLYNVVTLFIKS